MCAGCPAALAVTERQLAAAPQIEDVTDLSGLAILGHRRAFAEVGRFDERFGRGNWEDDDFCLRARLQGRRLVIARRAFVHHVGHATFEALGCDLGDELARGARIFQDKWGDDPAGRAWLASRTGRPAAHADLDDARLRWPGWLDEPLLRAQRAAADGDAEAAIDALVAFLHGCPRHPGARRSLATLRAGIGDVRGARRTLTTLERFHGAAVAGDGARR